MEVPDFVGDFYDYIIIATIFSTTSHLLFESVGEKRLILLVYYMATIEIIMFITKNEYSRYLDVFGNSKYIGTTAIVTNRSLPIIDRYFDVYPVKVYLIIITPYISYTV